ncbi:KR domain-containing protein [Streptomyces massasporeus]|uniref:KR domain-containing protein n=1 Tax=Streptomyces massasporeus TaxID=67324 RepID=UPI003701F34F
MARPLAAEHGVRHLLLTGRRGPEPPGAEEPRAELEELGARVDRVACDAADRAAPAEVIKRCDPPLRVRFTPQVSRTTAQPHLPRPEPRAGRRADAPRPGLAPHLRDGRLRGR